MTAISGNGNGPVAALTRADANNANARADGPGKTGTPVGKGSIAVVAGAEVPPAQGEGPLKFEGINRALRKLECNVSSDPTSVRSAEIDLVIAIDKETSRSGGSQWQAQEAIITHYANSIHSAQIRAAVAYIRKYG